MSGTPTPFADRRGGGRGLVVLLATLLVTAGLSLHPAAPPAHAAIASVAVDGHGWGHGRGLGQWGAYGYAVDHGWTHRQILDHYYGGTVAGTAPNSTMTVRLTAMDGADLLITSGAAFTIGGFTVAPGSAARLTRRPDGQYELYTRYGCSQPDAWYAGVVTPTAVSTVADPGNDIRRMLQVCQPNGDVRAYRGTLSLAYGDGLQRSINTVPLESYLRGVVPREAPASWADAGGGRGMQALMAQAVAARSYAVAEGGENGQRFNYAKTCDSTTCQVYGGAGLNGTWIEDPRSDLAVAQTAGEVRRRSGTIVRTEFSASTGGYTAGGQFPAVVDAGDSRSPYHNWTATFTGDAVGRALEVGSLQELTVTARNGLGAQGGRVLGVRVVGSNGAKTVTGDQFRSALGLRSDWFAFRLTEDPALEWYQRDSLTSGVADRSFRFGQPSSTAISCDWAGNGTDTAAVFHGGVWEIRLANSTGVPDLTLGFGDPGDVPLCGDWDGDGRVGLGVYRPSTWTFYLRNTLSTGPADVTASFGNVGDRPVVGDWDGDGTTTIGVFRPGNVTFYLSNTISNPAAHGAIPFGNSTDIPVVGAWAGARFTTIGVFREGVFYLKFSNFPGPTDAIVAFGNRTDRPVVGDWDGDATTEPGVVRTG